MSGTTPLSLTAQTLYAELLAQALALGPAGVGGLPGSTVEKAIGGRRYLYHQVVEPGGRRRQWYIGPADDARTATLLERVATARADAETDRVRLDELRAAFLAAGGQPLAPAAMRILKAFGDAGVLRPGPDGAVLVGTWAFLALANPLGVRWAGGLTTQDIDFAAAPTTIGLAIEHPERPAPDVLQSLDMGFVPIPTLDPRAPSTSFRIRGQELRVDFLTPLAGPPRHRPLFAPALGTYATPLRYLDYLIAESMPAVVVGGRALVLLNLPRPARFGLHKLLLARARPATDAVKATKDLAQAAQVLMAVVAVTPDELDAAAADLRSRGDGWKARLRAGCRALAKAHPEATDVVDAVMRRE